MKILTACTLDCPDACSLLVEEDTDQIRIAGNPAHPFTRGFICGKMKRFGQRLRHADRITTPLLRDGGVWRAIPWDQALDLCAKQIQRYRNEPTSILHIRGAADQGVLLRLTDLFFAKLGASRAGGTLCNGAGKAACLADFGSMEHNDVAELLNAHAIVNWGRDLSRSSVHLADLVTRARRRGARVVTVTTSGDGNRAYSDEMISIRPGTDRFLAAAVARLLIVHERIPVNIEQVTANWAEFKALLLSWSPEALSAACQVGQADIERLYAIYSRPDPVASIIGLGLQRYDYGGENVRFINALALISGNIGRSGGGSYYQLSGSSRFNLGWIQMDDQSGGRILLKPIIGREILSATNPPIRMVWVNATNIVNQAPNIAENVRAFESVEFKVVVDAFMNDTADRADLILPCALNLEKEDLVASALHEYVHYVRPAVRPPDGVRTDTWIVSELAKRLDPPIELPNEVTCLRASLDSADLPMALEDLRTQGFVRSARPRIAYEGMRFAHPDGKYRFPTELHDEPPAPSGYPLRLLSLVRREAEHSQIFPEEQSPVPSVWISPRNPLLGQLNVHAPVYLSSPVGRMQVRVQTQDDLRPDVVVYRRGDWTKCGGGINRVIEASVSDMGEGAPFYRQYVRLEN